MAPSGRTSLYLRVANHLRIYIQRRRLDTGDILPTEFDLCKRFRCSRGTVRRAMSLLVNEGKIRRRRGAGTFVAQPYVRPRTKALAAIVPNFVNAEIVRFVQTLGLAAGRKEYTLWVSASEYNPGIEHQFIDEIAQLKVTGVIKFPTNIKDEGEMRRRLRERGLPYVIINDFWTDSRNDCHLSYDQCAAVELAVDHLAQLGHRRIAFIDHANWPCYKAIEAFFKALKQRGCPHRKDHLLLCDTKADLIQIEKLYGDGAANPTAIVAAYDVLALPVVMRLRKLGLAVPEQVSVVNTNGMAVHSPYGIDLTTAVPSNERMVDRALEMLAGGFDPDEAHSCVYKPGFHFGETSAPCVEAEDARAVDTTDRDEGASIPAVERREVR